MARKNKHPLFRLIQNIAGRFEARFTATGRLALLALIIALIFALDPHQSTAYQFAAILLAIFCVALCNIFFRRARIEVKRHLPQYLTAGEEGEYEIEIHNQGSRPLKDLSLEDHLGVGSDSATETLSQPVATGASGQYNWWERKTGFMPWLHLQRLKRGARLEVSELISIGPGERRSVSCKITPLRRGVIYFDRLQVRQMESLGLLRRTKAFHAQDKIVSLPPRIPLPNVTWSSNRRHHRGGVTLANSVGDSQEFIGLRDYRPGDPLRQIHWRSFAKLGKPVIREHQDEYFDHHALVLITQIETGQEALFESAVSAAASFVDCAPLGDSLLDLVVVDEHTWRITSGRGVNPKSQLLEHLAVVQAKYQDRSEADALSIAEAVKHCGEVVLISCTWGFSARRTAELIRQQGADLLAIEIVDAVQQVGDRSQLLESSLTEELPELLLNHRGQR